MPNARVICGGLAVVASLSACAHDSGGVSSANAASAKAVGERLAAQDRADQESHRAMLAKLIRVDRIDVRQRERTITIAFDAHNLSKKRVTRIEAGFEADDPTSGKRIAMTEIRPSSALAARQTKRIVMTLSYLQFGEDAGPMQGAIGKPQRYAIDVKEIKYADGSDAGYDD